MLLFLPLPAGPDGQPFLPGVVAFRDHLDAQLIYYLPSDLELLTDANGDPDFFLLRYHGDSAEAQGGLLRFRLGFSSLADILRDRARSANWQLREAAFETARFRLRLRSLQEGQPDQLGDWHSMAPSKRELVAPAVSLNSRETQFLEDLLADARNAVEVEVELRYAGLVPGLPWLASAETATLKPLLAALLPTDPVRSDQVVAAFLSLPNPSSAGPLSWQPLEPNLPKPDYDTLLAEVALRSLDRLFERQPQPDEFTPALYRLRSADPANSPALSWDLLPPRQETRGCVLNWSVASLVQNLDTPEKRRKLFPTVSQVSPFAEVDIHVINRLPFDSHFLRKAVVDLRYSGDGGVPEFRSFTFDGTAELQRFSVFYPAVVGDFELASRFTTTQAPPSGSGWPVIRKGDFIPVSGTLVEVSRAAVGMDFVRVEAEPEVFNKASSIGVALFTSEPDKTPVGGTAPVPLVQLSLTSSQAAAWVALPGVDPATDLYVRAVAHGSGNPEPQPYTLPQNRVANRQVRIAAYQLEVLDPDRIILQLDPILVSRFALVQVTVAPLSGEGHTYRLEADHPVVWNFFRSSVFEELSYRYRLDYVAIDAQGHTLPMASTDWATAQGTTLVIQPPLNLPGGPP